MLTALFALALVAEPAAPACAYDRPAMLAMGGQAFDQAPGGWRKVGNIKGCEGPAADLIAAYREGNAAELAVGRPAISGSLIWHEAQLRAVAGQTASAITLFRRYTPSDEAMGAYRDATIAMLTKDKPALLAARARLAAVPKPANFDQSAAEMKARMGHGMSWPLNLDMVDGFVACFEKPYAEAYASRCRSATAP